MRRPRVLRETSGEAGVFAVSPWVSLSSLSLSLSLPEPTVSISNYVPLDTSHEQHTPVLRQGQGKPFAEEAGDEDAIGDRQAVVHASDGNLHYNLFKEVLIFSSEV